MEKEMKARIVHKHDVESNWLKANGFIPKKGEIIIYDMDDSHDYVRFKIGDGQKNVNILPFCSEPLGTAESTVSAHNTSVDSHNDIRLLIQDLDESKESKKKFGKLVVFGDSIGQGSANNNYSYVDILAESGAFEDVKKYCVGGATVGPYALPEYCLVNQIERYSNDVVNADIIICEYEGNDVNALVRGSVSIGNIKDDTTAKTVCGYTRKAIARILELNPLARIIWVPIVRNNFEWLNVAYSGQADVIDTYLLYEATVLRIASSLGCSVISAYTSYSIGPYLVDGLHPNTEGHKLIAEKILNNIYQENEYIAPTRLLTLTTEGFNGSFSKILSLLQAGANVKLKFIQEGIGINNFRVQYFDSNYIYFDGIVTYDGIADYIVRLRWKSDGSVDTIQYDIANGGSSGGDLGNEYEVPINGWTTLAYAGNPLLTAAEPIITKTASYMDVSQPTELRGGVVRTTSAINITNFTKLEVDLSNVILNGNGTTITIGIVGSNGENIGMLASKNIAASNDRVIHEIDVTSLTGNIYISIYLGTAQNGSASCRVYSVKLSKDGGEEVEYALKSDIPTKNSQLTNDSGFITSDIVEDLRLKTVNSLWNGELYANGNEYEIVTGGWWPVGYVFTQGLAAAAPTIDRQDSYMDVSLSGNYVSGLLSTSDDSLIDVTDFDKIQVEVSNVTIDNTNGGMWLLLSDENDNYSGTTKITADGIIERDISSLSGKYHVVISFAVVSGTNSLRIHKAKLIKNSESEEIDITADSITNALGYIPADEDDIPTKTSQLINDSGFLTEIDKEEIIQQVIAALPVYNGEVSTV